MNLDEKMFKVNEHIIIMCYSESTRSGFRHLATLYHDAESVVSAKVCYQNRTWESYRFQTVLFRVAEKAREHLSEGENQLLAAYVSGDRSERGGLKMLAALASLGNIVAETPKDQNDWKQRMLQAGLGEALDFPADWESLSEDEKRRRLDGAIGQLG